MPHGIDKSHSLVYEAEHLECIVGKTTEDTFHHFEKEAQWWINRIKSCKNEAEYFKVRHQYYHLIEVYQEHHFDFKSRAPACPTWSYIKSH